jgi:hypothetical protein
VKQPRKKTGPPPADGQSKQTRRSVLFSDSEVTLIVAKYGSLSGGVRAMFREIFEKSSEPKR